jgi:hypothetical protein
MRVLNRQSPRPRTGVVHPRYPRAMGLGFAVAVVACGQAGEEPTPDGGLVVGGWTSVGGGGQGGSAGDGGTGGADVGGAGGAAGMGGAPSQGGGAPCDALPSEGVYATFRVAGNETYYASITSAGAIDQAIALWRGQSMANIPNGTLVCEPVLWSCPWSFHQDPASIQFAEVTIEVCDGTPSYVDQNCATFGGQYCPWSVELVDLRDCRSDASCPTVPP